MLQTRKKAILFESNDACCSEAQIGQHMSLNEYRKNLIKFLTHPAIEAHKPRLILITPPPVEERRLEHRVKYQGYTKFNRSNERTKKYVAILREVARGIDLACLDLWSVFMEKAGWKEGEPLCGTIHMPENTMFRGLILDRKRFCTLCERRL